MTKHQEPDEADSKEIRSNMGMNRGDRDMIRADRHGFSGDRVKIRGQLDLQLDHLHMNNEDVSKLCKLKIKLYNVQSVNIKR